MRTPETATSSTSRCPGRSLLVQCAVVRIGPARAGDGAACSVGVAEPMAEARPGDGDAVPFFAGVTIAAIAAATLFATPGRTARHLGPLAALAGGGLVWVAPTNPFVCGLGLTFFFLSLFLPTLGGLLSSGEGAGDDARRAPTSDRSTGAVRNEHRDRR